MSERVRLLDHEAADVHRLVQDYALDGTLRASLHELLFELVEDAAAGDASVGTTVEDIIALILLERPARIPEAADLVNAIAEIYETALARRTAAASESRGAAG